MNYLLGFLMLVAGIAGLVVAANLAYLVGFFYAFGKVAGTRKAISKFTPNSNSNPNPNPDKD